MNVLFICEGNMVRSQIAEAFYNYFTETQDAKSAGTNAVGINSASRRAIEVMNELGISLEGHASKQLTPEMVKEAAKVVLFPVSNIPEYLNEKTIERWTLEDTGFGLEDSLEQDRMIRDEIRVRVEKLIEEAA